LGFVKNVADLRKGQPAGLVIVRGRLARLSIYK
jgi:hypothetical protein